MNRFIRTNPFLKNPRLLNRRPSSTPDLGTQQFTSLPVPPSAAASPASTDKPLVGRPASPPVARKPFHTGPARRPADPSKPFIGAPAGGWVSNKDKSQYKHNKPVLRGLGGR